MALTLADVEFKPGGVVLTVHRFKADQYDAGQAIAVAHGDHATTEPVAALDRIAAQTRRKRLSTLI